MSEGHLLLPENQPEQTVSKFGGLKVNKRAKSHRERIKFFDSAEWVMGMASQGHGGEQTERTDQEILSITQLPGEQQTVSQRSSPLVVSNEDSLLGC